MVLGKLASLIGLVIFMVPFVLSGQVEDCIAACNQANPGKFITFCGHENGTYTATQNALQKGIFTAGCVQSCGVALIHVGGCGCPNDCYTESNNGVCDPVAKQCVCNPGWGGKDCSMVKCPSNCSGHGACVSQTAKQGGDICACENGWTAYDCSVKIPDAFISTPYGTLPYGEISGDSTPYYQGEENGDAHPFFNTSAIATVKITVKDADLYYLFNPENLYTQDYVDAKMYFDNGVISKYMDITFRIKGSSTRSNIKRSWNIKFPKKDRFMDLKGFAMKTTQYTHVVSQQLVIDFNRFMKAQTYRSSLAAFFLNDRFYGLEAIQEKINDVFIESRWDVKDVDMYKMGVYNMGYLGDNATVYQSVVDTANQAVIEKEEGDDDWTNYVDLVTALNAEPSVSIPYVMQHFDVPLYIRSLAVEAIIKDADAYSSVGNNYILADARGGQQGPLWSFIGSDFDYSLINHYRAFGVYFGMTEEQMRALVESGVSELGGWDLAIFFPSDDPFVFVNRTDRPMNVALFRTPGAKEAFAEAVKEFVRVVIVEHPGVTQQRREAFHQLALPMVVRDKLYAVAEGYGPEFFEEYDNVDSANLINERWAYLASRFYANDHGSCDTYGFCSCHDNYFGAACDSYCELEFTQTKTNSWSTGSQNWSQWEVTLNVGAQNLYSVEIDVATDAVFTPWNIDKVAQSSNLYTIPKWQYSNGALAAASSHVKFGYTIGSSSSASFKMSNNACVPKACPLEIIPVITGSWPTGSMQSSNVQLQVHNVGSLVAVTVDLQIDFVSGSYISSSYNLAPSTSIPGSLSTNVTCSLYQLQPGQTSTSCGYILISPVSIVPSVNVVRAVCL